ncbi:hypothetical protein O988_00044 [Pseudogymnoascus sp. VKM F-3808]|nr:hypothetical protein O988_00044 [Pseudogymnoascus sp. VKM F-3808]
MSDIVERRLIDDLNRVPISDRIYEIGALHDHSELFTYVDYRGDPDIQQDNCGICISSIYVDSIRQLPCRNTLWDGYVSITIYYHSINITTVLSHYFTPLILRSAVQIF